MVGSLTQTGSDPPQAARVKVFISYSRKDAEDFATLPVSMVANLCRDKAAASILLLDANFSDAGLHEAKRLVGATV